MPNYSYEGLDKSGKRVKGHMSADDNKTAIMRVKELGIYPTDVKIARDNGLSRERLVKDPGTGKIRSSDLAIFSKQLANLVKGGLPLMRVFNAMTENTENPHLKAVLERMQQEIRGGKALWEALGNYPNVFPPLYVSMVKAGEASGQLSTVLGWLADYLGKEQSRKNQIRSALAYPTLLVIVGSITIACLVTFIVPKFVSVYDEFGQALPIPTVILLGISGFLLRWWWAIIAFAAAATALIKGYSRTPAGRFKIDKFKLRMPIFGRLNMKSSISKFARTTATLLQGGVPILDSMNIVRDVMGNSVLADGADQVRNSMREGKSFAAGLQDTGVYPLLLSHMAAIGEEAGDLQGVLLTVAEAYDVEVEATLKSLVSLLEPMIIVIIGGTIAFVIMAMLLPVFQINFMGQ